jgi:hypothetical protein
MSIEKTITSCEKCKWYAKSGNSVSCLMMHSTPYVLSETKDCRDFKEGESRLEEIVQVVKEVIVQTHSMGTSSCATHAARKKPPSQDSTPLNCGG